MTEHASEMQFSGEPTSDGDTAAEYLRIWYEKNRETDHQRKGNPWDRGLADNFMLRLMRKASEIENERRRKTGRFIDPDEFYAECLAHRAALNRAEAAEAKLAGLALDLYVLVPRVLSFEMAKALHDAVRIHCEPENYKASILNDRAVWDALLKAAEPLDLGASNQPPTSSGRT